MTNSKRKNRIRREKRREKKMNSLSLIRDTRFRVDLYIGDHDKLMEIVIYNDRLNEYSRWEFFHEHHACVYSIAFTMEQLMIRLDQYFENYLTRKFRESRIIKNKCRSLLLNLSSIETPDYYDYYNEKKEYRKETYFSKEEFKVKEGTYNDLGFFCQNVMKKVDELLKLDITNITQFMDFLKKYHAFKYFWIRNSEDFSIFLHIEHDFHYHHNISYTFQMVKRSLYYALKGNKDTKERNGPYDACKIEHFIRLNKWN